jgi:large subunit ribosomal protein L11
MYSLPPFVFLAVEILSIHSSCWNDTSTFKTMSVLVLFIAAKPGPAIGQALGPLGINMAQFCKEFNEKSEELYEKETPLRVELKAMSDRSYTFEIRSPPTAWLVKRAAGVNKGPERPSIDNPSGYITPEMVYNIALIKQADDNRWHLPLEGIARSVIGTARSIGILVREEQQPAAAEDGEAR